MDGFHTHTLHLTCFRYECNIHNQLGTVNMSSIVQILPGSISTLTPITTSKPSNETSPPGTGKGGLDKNATIIIIATSCVALSIFFVWAISCCCKAQTCCFKHGQHTSQAQYNNTPGRNINMGNPGKGIHSIDGVISNGGPTMLDSSYLKDEVNDNSKDRLLGVPNNKHMPSHPSRGEFEKRKEMDITSKIWKKELKRNIEAAKFSTNCAVRSELDVCGDSSLLSTSSVTDDSEKKALLKTNNPIFNISDVEKKDAKEVKHNETCINIDPKLCIPHNDSSSEKDSGTGDSKRSNENVDFNEVLLSETLGEDKHNAEYVIEGDYCENDNGDISNYHLSGGGESAMNLEEFEATVNTIRINGDSNDETSATNSINLYVPCSDEVDSALSDRLSGEPPNSSSEQLLADSGCGEAMPIYSAPDSVTSSSVGNPAEDSVVNLVPKSKKFNSFLDNSTSSISSSSCCHSKSQNHFKQRHQSNSDLKHVPCINNSASESAIKDKDMCKNGENKTEFRTFYPNGRSRSAVRHGLSYSALHTGSIQNVSDCDHRPWKKRTSTFELNGDCYLSFEHSVGELNSVTIDPILYRGGVGTLPRNTAGFELHQRLLEESLNNSDYAVDRRKQIQEENLVGREKSSSKSKKSLFSRDRKRSSSRNNEIPTISGSPAHKNSSYTGSLPRSKGGSSRSRPKSKHKPNGYSSYQEYKPLSSRVASNNHTKVSTKDNELFA